MTNLNISGLSSTIQLGIDGPILADDGSGGLLIGGLPADGFDAATDQDITGEWTFGVGTKRFIVADDITLASSKISLVVSDTGLGPSASLTSRTTVGKASQVFVDSDNTTETAESLILAGSAEVRLTDMTVGGALIIMSGDSIETAVQTDAMTGGTENLRIATKQYVDDSVVGGSGEPALGNPASDGDVLSSTIAGARSWITPPDSDKMSDWTDFTVTSVVDPNDRLLRAAHTAGTVNLQIQDTAETRMYWATNSEVSAAGPFILTNSASANWFVNGVDSGDNFFIINPGESCQVIKLGTDALGDRFNIVSVYAIPAEADTLDSVTTRGDTTTNDITVGVATAENFISNGVGSPTLDSATTITLNAPDGVHVTGGAFRLPNMTDVERLALTPGNGDMIYNTDDNKIQAYENGLWVNVVSGTPV